MMTWILIAHRAEARIYKTRGPGGPLGLVDRVAHRSGRSHPRDLDSDRPGRFFSLGSPARSAADPERNSADVLAEEFALELARKLDHARTSGDFDGLILAAEPKMLGRLRQALSRETARLVIAEADKDLSHLGRSKLGLWLRHELSDAWNAALVRSA